MLEFQGRFRAGPGPPRRVQGGYEARSSPPRSKPPPGRSRLQQLDPERPQPTVTQVEAIANDALLTTEVKAKLITVDVNSTASLGVRVSGGVATLTGAVRTPAARAKTVAAARSVPGIHAVRDQLRIDPHVPDLGQRLASRPATPPSPGGSPARSSPRPERPA